MMTATVSMMRPTDTPTAEAKAITLPNGPAVGRIANVINMKSFEEKAQWAKNEQNA